MTDQAAASSPPRQQPLLRRPRLRGATRWRQSGGQEKHRLRTRGGRFGPRRALDRLPLPRCKRRGEPPISKWITGTPPLDFPRGLPQRLWPEAWEADALPTELLPLGRGPIVPNDPTASNAGFRGDYHRRRLAARGRLRLRSCRWRGPEDMVRVNTREGLR
jgi:hypothetical protein